jgi:pyruvate formate lyase activating enzyme
MAASQPTIFAIKRYAIHDGPNIRTTVFLKGCPLSCWWCHNPEGMSPAIDMITVADRCVGCGYCADQCPQQALAVTAAGPVRDQVRCRRCGNCIEICPALVYETTGWTTSISEVMAEIKKDLPFHDHSGGGVTFSGGEPLFQPEFLIGLLKECGKLDIHRAVDTSGFAPTATILEVARHTDIFLFDLKLMDNDRHRLYTGVANDLIHTNITALARKGCRIRIRLPLIPGVNDDNENITHTGSFVAGLPGVTEIDLLPYHRSAETKYRKLAIKNQSASFPALSEEKVQQARAILERIGLKVYRGG